MNRANIAYHLHSMVPAPAGASAPRVIYKSEDGILDCFGTTVPTDGTDGYAVGCTFRHTDADVLATGTVDSADATSLIDATLATTYDADDELIGLYVIDINKQIMGLIDDYAYATGDITVDDWTDYDGTAVDNTIYPAAGDSFKILKLSAPTIYENRGDQVRGCRFRPMGATDGNSHITTGMEVGPTPAIWDDCPVLEIIQDPGKGWYYFNDFTSYPILANGATSYVGSGCGWFTAATAGKTAGVVDDPAGVVQLFMSDDNEGGGLVCCNDDNQSGLIYLNATTPKGLWIEARLKHVNITDSRANVFVGIAEEALNAAGGITVNDGTTSDKDYIGFWRDEDDGDKYDLIHNTAGGGGVTALSADACTLVADTYHKVGMKLVSGDKTLTLYYNGEPIKTVELDATNVPDGQEMAFYIQMMAANDADFYVEVDWIRICQLR